MIVYRINLNHKNYKNTSNFFLKIRLRNTGHFKVAHSVPVKWEIFYNLKNDAWVGIYYRSSTVRYIYTMWTSYYCKTVSYIMDQSK